MGHTHYLYQKRSLTPEEWKRLVDKTRGIIERASASGIVLTDVYGDPGTKPELDDSNIALNGNPPFEGFVVERERRAPRPNREDPPQGSFSFCKTGQLPYDAVVVSILHALRTIAPDAVTIESDGGEEAIREAV